MLDFIGKMLQLNRGKAMLQVDPAKNVDDGFMINFACVMLSLSERVTVNKLQANYLFHPKCRLHLNDETRMKFDSEEVKQLTETLGLLFSF
jgi:hypothetical protein